MKIRKVAVTHFRSIEQSSFELDDYLVLIGENGAGKSNLLRALDLFFADSIRGMDEESFWNKQRDVPIEIAVTFDRLSDPEKADKTLDGWIVSGAITIKKTVTYDPKEKTPYKTQFSGWMPVPKDVHFDLGRFEEYKDRIKSIVADSGLPDYFKTDKGTVTQASYKAGVQQHRAAGLVECDAPGWIDNPAGLKEVLVSHLPRFYLLPAVRDAEEECKCTSTTYFGKLLADLTGRIVQHNPKFRDVKAQLEGLKKYLNPLEDGTDDDRLAEIKGLESTVSTLLSESMPDSKIRLEIVTPELLDLFKETRVFLADGIVTSIDSKGHGLQRALIFAFIRAYADYISRRPEGEGEQALLDEASARPFILAVEEPELFLHPNGQRRMFSVLHSLATKHQVFVCTHSNYFVDLYDYPAIGIVRCGTPGQTQVRQFRGDIFEKEQPEDKKRYKKVFRCLSYFDLGRSELFFARRVVLVEGATEKVVIPLWSDKLIGRDKRYDLVAQNTTVIDCGGKTNIHVFARVLNRFAIPYLIIHDEDPIDFPEDKPNKTDEEEKALRMYKENDYIARTVDQAVGSIRVVVPELEPLLGISKTQADKLGKPQAAYMAFVDRDPADYSPDIIGLMDEIAGLGGRVTPATPPQPEAPDPAGTVGAGG